MKQKLEHSETGVTLFLTPQIKAELFKGPTLYCTVQIIVSRGRNNGWVVEECAYLDCSKIEHMGVTIDKRDNVNKFLKSYHDMGIDLGEYIERCFDEVIAFSGDIETFVKESTGIILP